MLKLQDTPPIPLRPFPALPLSTADCRKRSDKHCSAPQNRLQIADQGSRQDAQATRLVAVFSTLSISLSCSPQLSPFSLSSIIEVRVAAITRSHIRPQESLSSIWNYGRRSLVDSVRLPGVPGRPAAPGEPVLSLAISFVDNFP